MARTRATCRNLLIAAITAVTASVTSADRAAADWDQFWHSVHIGYHRNNAWPHPFLEVAAAQTRAPFEVMKHNGWRLHNTIGHELFREGDGLLTPAGRGQLEWIATQAPVDRRVVYVLRGRSAKETDARMASVRQTLDTMHTAGPPPQVMITDVVPASASGAWATQINRTWLSSLPEPKLPTSASNTPTP